MANPFQQLRVDPQSVRRSQAWYQKHVQNLGNLSRGVNAALKQGEASIVPGGLYMFKYDPKHKDKLPYYDTLPLVLPFADAPGGFLGINLHYLPYGLRFKLMGALLELVTDIEDPQSRAQVSWSILNGSSKYPGVSACVKHYLTAQVKSQFLDIPNDQWLAAAMMPIEQFSGASKEQVYKNSRRMM
jgi:hypothetical protein